jgi:hypothetical protein
MTFDPFEAAIDALPSAKLATLGREIDAQISELQRQSRQVAQRLQDRQAEAGPAPSRTQRSSGHRAKRGVGRKRQAFIKQLVDADPRKQWIPADLTAELHTAGDTEATKDSVRNIARDMIEAGVVARHPSGNGIMGTSGLASTNGSEQEPLMEAQT